MSFVLFFLPIFLLLLGPIHQVWNDNVSYILNYAVIYYYKNLSNKINHIQCTIYVEGTVISDLYCSSRKLLMTFFKTIIHYGFFLISKFQIIQMKYFFIFDFHCAFLWLSNKTFFKFLFTVLFTF